MRSDIPFGPVHIHVDRSRCSDEPRHTFVQDAMGGLKVICRRCHMIDDFVHGFQLLELCVITYSVRFDREENRWRIDLFDAEGRAIEHGR